MQMIPEIRKKKNTEIRKNNQLKKKRKQANGLRPCHSSYFAHPLAWDLNSRIVHNDRQTKNQSTERVRILELEEKFTARATAKYVHGACYIFR